MPTSKLHATVNPRAERCEPAQSEREMPTTTAYNTHLARTSLDTPSHAVRPSSMASKMCGWYPCANPNVPAFIFCSFACRRSSLASTMVSTRIDKSALLPCVNNPFVRWLVFAGAIRRVLYRCDLAIRVRQVGMAAVVVHQEQDRLRCEPAHKA